MENGLFLLRNSAGEGSIEFGEFKLDCLTLTPDFQKVMYINCCFGKLSFIINQLGKRRYIVKFVFIVLLLDLFFQRDSTVAKLLLSAIFQAIFANMDEVKTEREMGETIDQINKSLDNILSLSTKYYPPFIACVLVSNMLFNQVFRRKNLA